MNNSRTPKIVVGVGLAAVYAAGLSFYMLRSGDESTVAPMPATAPVASIASAPEPPPSIAPPLAETPVEATAPVPVAEPAVSNDARASVRRREPVRAEQPVNPPTNAPAPPAPVVADGGSEIPRADGAAALIGEEPADSEAIATASDEEGDEIAASGNEGSADIEQPAMPAGPDDSVEPN